MPDVTVTVRGKDDGLSQMFEDIRRKAEALGVSTDRLGGFGTKTQTVQAVGSTAHEIAERQKQEVTEKYERLHQAAAEKLEANKNKLRSGEIDRPAYDREVNKFDKYSEELGSKEDQELKQIDKESLTQLKNISKLLADREKIEREQKQRENKEFENDKAGSFYGKMQKEKERLEDQMMTAPDEEGFKKSKEELDAIKERMGLLERQGGGMGGGSNVSSIMSGLAGGNVLGLLGLMKNLWPVAALAGVVGLMSSAESNDKDYSRINAYQGGDIDNKKRLKREFTQEESLGGSKKLIPYGISDEEMSKDAEKMAKASGSAANLFERSFKAAIIERGLGVDNVSQYSSFDRQDKSGKSISDNIVEMVNILTGIKGGSLKRDDLTLLGEKLQIANQLSSFQFQRQDKVDRQQIFSQMAGVEKFFGISGRDQRAGDLITGINQAAASGSGNANLEYMKWAAARKSHPEMNDEELAGMMEKGWDPEYKKAYFTSGKRLYKEGTFGAYATKKIMLSGLNVDQRQQAMGPNGALFNPEFYNVNLEKLKNSVEGNGLDYQNIAERSGVNSASMKNFLTELKQTIKTDIGTHLDNFVQEQAQTNTTLETGTLKVVVVNQNAPQGNKTKKGNSGAGGQW